METDEVCDCPLEAANMSRLEEKSTQFTPKKTPISQCFHEQRKESHHNAYPARKKRPAAPYRRSDLTGILSWTNDTEATRYLTEIFDQPYTEKNGEDFLNYALSGGSERMMFVMADPVTEEYWGQISLERISRRDGTAEVGVVLAKEEHRGKGIGREALSLLLRYAFDALGLRRVELTVFAENSRARLCYLKAGFIEEGVARQKTWKNGKFHDIVSMAVLRDEWAKREEQA